MSIDAVRDTGRWFFGLAIAIVVVIAIFGSLLALFFTPSVQMPSGPRFQSGVSQALDDGFGLIGAGDRLHFVVQFERELTPAELEDVADFVGNSLDGPVPENAYITSVSAADWVAVRDRLVSGTPRAIKMLEFRVADRLAPEIRNPNDPALADLPDYAETAPGSGLYYMFVRFFDDVPVAEQRQILLQHGATQPGGGLLSPGPTGIWAVILPGANVDVLANRQEVRFIEPTTPPVEEDLDQVRGEIGATAVSYDGAGATIAQWEGCQPTTKHPDIQGRVHPIGAASFRCRKWRFQDVNESGRYDIGEPIGVDRDEDGMVETILHGTPIGNDWLDLPIRLRPLISRRYVDVGDVEWETDTNDITFAILANTVQPMLVPASEAGFALIKRDYYSEFHPTMVAGIVIGNSQSNTSGSFSPQPRYPGIVPAAHLRSYAWNHYSKTLEYPDAIAAGARISTNSFGWSLQDYHFDSSAPPYPDTAQFYDEVVSGRADNGLPSGLAARMLIVASAGNEGDDPTFFWRTGRIVNSAKNVIAVGNVSSSDAMTLGAGLGSPAQDSGRGPTMDDRLTPILSAPGTESGGDSGITSTSLPEAKYEAAAGTSFSTPAVSGAAAQLRGVYEATCTFAPAPQDLRALLIHSASDLTDASDLSKVPPGTDLVGPDFVFGYGLVQVDAAAALVRRAITDTIKSGWVEHRVSLNNNDQLVENNGVAQLRVTLVWDDPPYYTEFPPRKDTGILQNDLDLEVIDPAHNRHLPWVLDASSGNEADPATRTSRPPLLYVLQSYRDHRNTIEQVVVDVPSGMMNETWTIRVRGFKLRRAPQSYTLVSEVFQTLPMTACGSFANGSTVRILNPLDIPDTPWAWILFWLAVIVLLWAAFEAAISLFTTVASKYGTSLALFGVFVLLSLLAAIFYSLVGFHMLVLAALVLFGIAFALWWVVTYP